MLTKSMITVAAALSTASAAFLPGRQVVTPLPSQPGDGVPSGVFNISGFSVAAEPHGLYTFYTLTLTDAATKGPQNVTTSCRSNTTTIPAISGFPLQACDDPSVKWSFMTTTDGYNMTVKHNWGITVQHAIVSAYDNLTDTAHAFFPKSDVKQNPSVEGFYTPYLDAPSAFTLEYSRYAL